MSRAAGGAYTLPAGNPVVTGTIISSTWGNTTLADIATALTDSLSRSGLGGMTAVLLGVDGAVGAPAYSFTNEPTSGFYRQGAGNIRLSILGVDNATFTATTATLAGALTAASFIPSGAAVPANGMYLSAANTVAFSSNTTLRGSVNSAGNWVINAPSSGSPLSITGAASGNTLLTLTGGATSDVRILFSNAAAQSNLLQFQQSAANAAFWGVDQANTFVTGSSAGDSFIRTESKNFRVSTNAGSSTALLVAPTGNVTIAAPSSGNTLSITNIAGQAAVVAAAGAATAAAISVCGNGASFGTNSFDIIQDTGGLARLFNRANTSLDISTNGTQRMLITATGAITVNAPTSGAALTVSGSASTPVNAIGNSSTAFTLDCSKSNVQTVTMNGTVAAGSLTISNIQDGQTINLILTQDGVGSRLLGNPTGVKWPGGTVGVLSTAAAAIDLITFTRVSGTTYASISKAFA
jgi:hypothetical protein